MRKRTKPNTGTPARRQQILAAALDCFAETGFVDATMEDIRARSGASNGSIYHHFKSKDQLAAAVYLEGIRDYQQGLAAALPDLPARQGIYEIVRYHLDWVDRNPRWARYLFAMRHADFMKPSEESIAQQNSEFGAVLSEWFAAHVRVGRLRRLPREMYLCLIWGPCQEYARHWLRGNHSPEELQSAAREIAGAAWHALQTKKQ